jgi:hypothetical protein
MLKRVAAPSAPFKYKRRGQFIPLGDPTMKLPRLRFTIRAMMVTVATVTPHVWTANAAWRWVDCRSRALQQEELARVLSIEMVAIRKQGASEGEVKGVQGEIAEAVRQARRYRRGMERPWLPIEPNPSQPK